MHSPKYLPLIDLTRGLAALAIFALHVILFGHDRYGFAFPAGMAISNSLKAGVDLFFILSGFLMVHTTRDQAQRNPKEFLLKRFIRIYPAYWFVFLLTLPIYFFKPEWTFYRAAVKPSLPLSFLLLPQNGPPNLAVAWTLVYEVYFYLLFAITLFLTPKRQAVVLGLFFLLSVGIGYFGGFIQPVAQFFTAGFLLDFYAGMMLAHLWLRFPKHMLLSLLCFVSAFLWLLLQPIANISRSIDLGIPAFFLFTGMLVLQKNEFRFPERLSHFLGRISYPLYLIHVPIIAGLPKLMPYLGLHFAPGVLLCMAIVFSLFAGIGMHYFIEIPLQRYLKQKTLGQNPLKTVSSSNIVEISSVSSY